MCIGFSRSGWSLCYIVRKVKVNITKVLMDYASE